MIIVNSSYDLLKLFTCISMIPKLMLQQDFLDEVAATGCSFNCILSNNGKAIDGRQPGIRESYVKDPILNCYIHVQLYHPPQEERNC
jgi:hypothetical protein